MGIRIRGEVRGQDLDGLRGVLEIAGTVDVPSGLSTYDYEGTIHRR